MLWTFSYAHVSLPPLSAFCSWIVFTEHEHGVKKYRPKQNWKTQYCAEASNVLIEAYIHKYTRIRTNTYWVCVCKCDDCAATVTAVVAICRQ